MSWVRLLSARSQALDRDYFNFLKTVPNAHLLTLGTIYFDECPSLTLGKKYLHFFLFFHQIFCGVFLQYIDLQVSIFGTIIKVFAIAI
jgi:hypothetical protein